MGPERRHLVLVGMMGTGKSTVGRLLAHRLGRPFLDTDALAEARGGRDVASLFAALGEEGFRSIERDVLATALGGEEATVLSCGGGAVLDPGNRRLMRQGGLVVWLSAPPDELARRLRSTREARPLLAGQDSPIPVLERLCRERETAYREVADLEVATAGRGPSAVVDAVLAGLGLAGLGLAGPGRTGGVPG